MHAPVLRAAGAKRGFKRRAADAAWDHVAISRTMIGHAEIAGAGFAGLAAAIGLARQGWTVRVHERDDTPRSHGAGIYVHPFAQAVLRDLGAFDRVAATAFAPAARHIHIDGHRRSVTETAGQVLTTTRAHLHAAVLATAIEAGATIVTNSHATSADPAGALLLENGTRLEADLVIAADGVRAAIAQAAGITLTRRRHEDGITRIMLDRAGLQAPEWDDIHDFYDYRHRPLRILYTPCGPDVFYLCLTAPAHDEEGAAVPIATDLWARSFPMLAPTLRRIGDRGRHDRYTTTTMPNWSRGHIAILGDAAHAMPSALGQGAGVSMQNALHLAQSLAAAPTVPAGLAAWEAQARPIVERWQREAEAVASSRSLTSAVHPGEDFATERSIVQRAAPVPTP
jgi:2-methyl-3-hydroxypyridine 5-carboxylic acid dioxygenase